MTAIQALCSTVGGARRHNSWLVSVAKHQGAPLHIPYSNCQHQPTASQVAYRIAPAAVKPESMHHVAVPGRVVIGLRNQAANHHWRCAAVPDFVCVCWLQALPEHYRDGGWRRHSNNKCSYNYKRSERCPDDDYDKVQGQQSPQLSPRTCSSVRYA